MVLHRPLVVVLLLLLWLLWLRYRDPLALTAVLGQIRRLIARVATPLATTTISSTVTGARWHTSRLWTTTLIRRPVLVFDVCLDSQATQR